MQEVYNFINKVVDLIINPLIEVLMAAALAYFLWGAANLILNGDNPEKRKKGQEQLLWGIIGLFIMVSVFGILNVALSTFCTPSTGPNGTISCGGDSGIFDHSNSGF